jgi:GH25 family lysozyme M1 (1,4-beta-N-acetylmuramidase)
MNLFLAQLKQNIENNWIYGENPPIRLHKLPSKDEIVDTLIQPDLTKVWGIDISHWNGLTDLATAKARGCSFVIIKGCDGSVNSKWFPENKQRAKDVGMPWGVYVWLYPGSKVSIDAQVTAWWNLVKNDYPPMGVFIDVEWTTYGGYAANPTTADANAALDKFLAISGKKAKIYTARGYSDQYLVGFNRYDTFGLWVAHYGVTNPLLPIGATTYKIHQFTSSLDGSIAPSENLALDGNYYNGTKAQFEAEFGAVTPPPPVGEPMDYKIVWDTGANERTGPGISYTWNGITHVLGEIVKVVTVQVNNPAIEEWGQLENGNWIATIYNAQPRAVPVAPVFTWPDYFDLVEPTGTKQRYNKA